MKTSIQLFVLVGLMTLLSACGGRIPSPYRGDFVDQVSGNELLLEKNAGTLKFATGETLNADADALEFEKLNELKSGIYTRISSVDENLMEVYWIVPNRATLQEVRGFVWFEAEVVHAELNTQETEPVQRIQLAHSSKGVVMLDRDLKEWQVGWPQGAAEYVMQRKPE